MKSVSILLFMPLAALMIATGCKSGSNASGPIKTSTGLPYYPPGPTTMVDAPADLPIYVPAKPVLTAEEASKVSAVTARSVRTVNGARYVDGSGIDTNAWRVAAGHWIGTPHKTGGDDHSGIDCSAYVSRLYQEVAGQFLPRTASDMWSKGQPVGNGPLEPGDLVFFQTVSNEDASHVGVSLGGREFTHSSTSKGVTISSMDEPYWRERYTGARRVLVR
ncbi:MAG TPA: NlpC/P60 family protein [Candidatus Limnocylindria bacterium]|jgi:cell wall-associated NlpC family hydrolase|nr:NlpC/P60 family protein [Candidatus Limnocylindria bacterium]